MVAPYHPVDRRHELAPGLPLLDQHLAAFGSDPVVAAAPLPRTLQPAALDEPPALEPAEHRVKRCDPQSQLPLRALLDALADVVAVPRPRLDQGQDHQLGAAFLELPTEHRSLHLVKRYIALMHIPRQGAGVKKKMGGVEGSVKSQLARADVGVQAITPGAFALERAEEASFVDVEGGGVDFAGGDRSVDAGVLLGTADFDVHLAGGHLEVLASGDVLHVELASGHADVKLHRPRDLDGDPEVVVGAASDLHHSRGPRGLHPDGHLAEVLLPAGAVGHANLAFVHADDLRAAGAEAHLEASAGREIDLDGLLADLFDLAAAERQAHRQQRYANKESYPFPAGLFHGHAPWSRGILPPARW